MIHTKRTYITISLMLLYICLGSGCRPNGGRTAVKDGFLLHIQRPDLEQKITHSVDVRKCRAAVAFGGRSLVYRTSTVEYEIDRFNNLLVPVDQQLTEAIQRWFRPTDIRADADIPPGRVVIETTLDELVGDFVNRAEPQARVQIAFKVTLDESRTRTVILDQVYSTGVKVPLNPTAGQVVTAMSRSIEQVLQEFEADLVKSLNSTN